MDHQHITRRQALVGAVIAAVSVGATAAVSASSIGEMQFLVEAHRSAKARLSSIEEAYATLAKHNPTPDMRVVTGVDHFTKVPCSWGYSSGDIRLQAEQRKFSWFGGKAHANIDAWADRKIAELAAIGAERHRIRTECGLDTLFYQVDAAEANEYEAWRALVSAKPADLREAGGRAAYLMTVHDDPNDGNHPLAYWLEEYLGSFLP